MARQAEDAELSSRDSDGPSPPQCFPWKPRPSLRKSSSGKTHEAVAKRATRSIFRDAGRRRSFEGKNDSILKCEKYLEDVIPHIARDRATSSFVRTTIAQAQLGIATDSMELAASEGQGREKDIPYPNSAARDAAHEWSSSCTSPTAIADSPDSSQETTAGRISDSKLTGRLAGERRSDADGGNTAGRAERVPKGAYGGMNNDCDAAVPLRTGEACSPSHEDAVRAAAAAEEKNQPGKQEGWWQIIQLSHSDAATTAVVLSEAGADSNSSKQGVKKQGGGNVEAQNEAEPSESAAAGASATALASALASASAPAETGGTGGGKLRGSEAVQKETEVRLRTMAEEVERAELQAAVVETELQWLKELVREKEAEVRRIMTGLDSVKKRIVGGDMEEGRKGGEEEEVNGEEHKGLGAASEVTQGPHLQLHQQGGRNQEASRVVTGGSGGMATEKGKEGEVKVGMEGDAGGKGALLGGKLKPVSGPLTIIGASKSGPLSDVRESKRTDSGPLFGAMRSMASWRSQSSEEGGEGGGRLVLKLAEGASGGGGGWGGRAVSGPLALRVHSGISTSGRSLTRLALLCGDGRCVASPASSSEEEGEEESEDGEHEHEVGVGLIFVGEHELEDWELKVREAEQRLCQVEAAASEARSMLRPEDLLSDLFAPPSVAAQPVTCRQSDAAGSRACSEGMRERAAGGSRRQSRSATGDILPQGHAAVQAPGGPWSRLTGLKPGNAGTSERGKASARHEVGGRIGSWREVQPDCSALEVTGRPSIDSTHVCKDTGAAGTGNDKCNDTADGTISVMARSGVASEALHPPAVASKTLATDNVKRKGDGKVDRKEREREFSEEVSRRLRLLQLALVESGQADRVTDYDSATGGASKGSKRGLSISFWERIEGGHYLGLGAAS